MISMENRRRSHSAPARRSWGCVLIAGVIWSLLASPAAAQYGGGSGADTDPYLIRTAEDLSTIGRNPGDWDKHFKLVADIDLQGYDEKSFTLIGHWVTLGDAGNKPFGGFFDGDGRTIANFTYNGGKQDNIGLFRYVAVGQIRNVRLVDAKVNSDGLGLGALVGYVKTGAIVDCQATGVHVTGNTRVGGLVGSLEGMVSQCSSRGHVAGVRYVGGLIGEIGQGTVTRSYSKAAVSGQESVGGLVGATLHETSIVESCYATGSVSGGTYVGGLAGQVVQGRAYKCYSTGLVHGNVYTGGLVGSTRVLGDVIVSFWDVQTSGQATSGGGMGKSTAEMRSWDTFSAWDFGETWSICEGASYPVFWWQVPVADLHCPDGVNASDFAWFAVQWKRRDCGEVNSHCRWADFDRSGSVGYLDLAILARDWLTGMD